MDGRDALTPSPGGPAARAPEHALLARVGEAERRLAELERLLARRSRLEELGELAGGLAHELANLLVPMHAGVRALEGRGVDGVGAQVSQLGAGVRGCAELAGAVLRLSQDLAVAGGPFEVSGVVGDAVELATALDRRGRVRVTVEEDGLWGEGSVPAVRGGIANGIVYLGRMCGGLGSVRVEVKCSTWNMVRGLAGVDWGAGPAGGGGNAVVVSVRGGGASVGVVGGGGAWKAAAGRSVGLALAGRLLARSGGAIGASAEASRPSIVVAFPRHGGAGVRAGV